MFSSKGVPKKYYDEILCTYLRLDFLQSDFEEIQYDIGEQSDFDWYDFWEQDNR